MLVAGTVAGALHVLDIGRGTPAPLAAATIGEEVVHLQVGNGRIDVTSESRSVRSLAVVDVLDGSEGLPPRLVDVGRITPAPLIGKRFFLRGHDLYGEGRHALVTRSVR